MRIENGYYIWDKGERKKLSDNFSTHEFNCQCTYKTCVEQKLAVSLVDKLQAARDEADEAFKITSGFRCTRRQTDLVANPNIETVKLSQHELGHAADVKPLVQGMIQLNRMMWILAKQFDSIGIAHNWFHVDIRPGYRRWRYK